MTEGEYQLVQLRDEAWRHFRELDRFRQPRRFSPIIKALAATIDAVDAELRTIREGAAK